MTEQNAIYYVSYQLKKGASVEEFLAATEALNNEEISKKQGYISWQQLRHGEIWADMLTFETMDDLEKFNAESANPSELAMKFYSFINPSAKGSKLHYFTVEKSY